MSTAKKEKQGTSHLKANEAKWGSSLVEAGWTLVPSTILERQQALGLDPVDLNILLQIARYWWKKDNPPHPSRKAIAECIGKSVSTVQRRLNRLVRDGLIEIEHRHNQYGGRITSNYRFTGLIMHATEYAQESLEDREQRRAEARAKRTRKGVRRSSSSHLRVMPETK